MSFRKHDNELTTQYFNALCIISHTESAERLTVILPDDVFLFLFLYDSIIGLRITNNEKQASIY